MAEMLHEYFIPERHSMKIDRSRNVIHGVKILGTESRNLRRYPLETLVKAIPLYENAKVNVDHPEGSHEPRSYSDRIGTIKSVGVINNDGLYADFHFNPKHPLMEQLLWDAEHAPENVGFSHNVEAIVRNTESDTIVEEILAVRSVDIVADPATTSGLFESEISLQKINNNDDDSHQEDIRSLNNTIESLRDVLEIKQREIQYEKFKSGEIQRLYEQIHRHRNSCNDVMEILFHKSFFEMIHNCNNEVVLRNIIDDRIMQLEQMASRIQQTHGFPKSRPQTLFVESCANENQEDLNGVIKFVRDISR